MSAKPTSRELHELHEWERAQGRIAQRDVKAALALQRAHEARRVSALVQDPAVCDDTGFCEGGLL